MSERPMVNITNNGINMKNVAFVTRESSSESRASTKLTLDMLETAQSIGIRIIVIPGKGIRYFFSLARINLKDIDFAILLYPGVVTIRQGGLLDFVKNVIEICLIGIKKFQYRCKLILYVYDLPLKWREAIMGLQPSFLDRLAERMIFVLSDIMGVFGPKMKDMIACQYPPVKNKCVYYKFIPYFASAIKKDGEFERPIKIALVGNLVKPRLGRAVDLLAESPMFSYNFYGPHGEWLQNRRADFKYVGVYSPDELLQPLNEENHFGLVLYDITNNAIKEYFSMAMSSKFLCYIAAGLPIISYRFEHMAEIIEEYGLGYVVDDPTEIAEKLSEISADSYQRMTKNVASFAEYLLKEDFLKQFILKVIKHVS